MAQRFGFSKEVKVAEPPLFLKYLWEWFCELSAQRRQGPNGPSVLAYADIQAWSNLTETPIASHELRMLLEIDHIFLSEASHAQKRTQKGRE